MLWQLPQYKRSHSRFDSTALEKARSGGDQHPIETRREPARDPRPFSSYPDGMASL